jgi:radical SAM superfamily enzyme YgiQ (UPF0313 family)
MKSKILLIRPRNLLSLNNYPPLALILLGSALERAGFDVEIFVASNHDDYLSVIENRINDDMLFVGLTVLTTEVSNAITISERVKKISDVPVVWGGWHATLFPEQIVKSDIVDYVVVNEGDELIVQLANLLRRGEKPEQHILSAAEHIKMDDLPFPDYSLVNDIDKFISRPLVDKFQESLEYPLRWLPYQSSRGCPGQCTFCINVVTNNQRYRTKSAKKVVDELELLIRKYDINHFKILDDNFFVVRKRVEEFCKLVIERGLKFTWDGECRVDYFRPGMVDGYLLNLLRKTSLVQLVLGVESASKKTLEYLRKGTTVDNARTAVKELNRFGIISDCAFIVGLPGETREDIMKTSDFINEQRQYDTFVCGVQTYRPYPKSKIAEQLIKEDKLKVPQNVYEWADENIVSMYTYVDAYRPWIQDYDFAMNISYYQSLASSVWLFDHQLESFVCKLINRFFKQIAIFRTRNCFFKFPFDKRFYSAFRTWVYKSIERKEQQGIV